MDKYDITDYLKDDKELQKAVIEEFLNEIAEFKAENARLRTCLDTQRIDETNQYIKKVNVERKNYKLKQILQEIKKYIAKICKEECGYVQKKRCPDCDCRFGAILDLITKAEEE